MTYVWVTSNWMSHVYGGIILPPSCNINYVNTQYNYVDKHHNYINMWDNYVYMWNIDMSRVNIIMLHVDIIYLTFGVGRGRAEVCHSWFSPNNTKNATSLTWETIPTNQQTIFCTAMIKQARWQKMRSKILNLCFKIYPHIVVWPLTWTALNLFLTQADALYQVWVRLHQWFWRRF